MSRSTSAQSPWDPCRPAQMQLLHHRAAMLAISWPVATDPVKAITGTSGWRTSGSPASAAVAGDHVDDAGRQMRKANSASRSVVSGVYSDGLMTTVLPAASGRDLPCQQQRVVPRHDAGHDAVRFFDDKLNWLDRRAAGRSRARAGQARRSSGRWWRSTPTLLRFGSGLPSSIVSRRPASAALLWTGGRLRAAVSRSLAGCASPAVERAARPLPRRQHRLPCHAVHRTASPPSPD